MCDRLNAGRNLQFPGQGHAFPLFEVEILNRRVVGQFRVDRFHGKRIEQFQLGDALHGGLAQIRDFGAVADLVAFAEEPWHGRLHHQFLLGDRFRVFVAGFQVFGMGECPEFPARQRLGHREFQDHIALRIGAELREKEGGFIEIGTNLDLGKAGIAAGIGTIASGPAIA